MDNYPAIIAWIDVETTGLDTREGHRLLQLACIVTDKNFTELGTIEQKFRYSPEEIEQLKELCPPVVRHMHEATGLWQELTHGMELEEFDEVFLQWLKSLQPEPRVLYFGGNSIFLDREFTREFLPKSYEHLNYRDVNMTSVETFHLLTEERPWFPKKKVHDALSDIRESIASAVYQREQNLRPRS